MGLFTHKTAKELKNEDKWIHGKLTLKQFLTITIEVVLMIILFETSSKLIGMVPTFAFDLIILIFTGIAAFVPIAKENFLSGGGLYIPQIILRVILHKINRRIYVKHYKEGSEW